MTARTTTSFSLFQAKAFLSYFRNLGSGESLYAFTSNPIPIDEDENNDIVIPNPTIIPQFAKKAVYDFALTAKKIEPNSASLCTKRIDWMSGQIYTPYRNDINVVRHDEEFYVMKESVTNGVRFLNVYKCLYAPFDTDNGITLPSTSPPESRDLTPFITNDGYIWKYMYSISPFQESSFLTREFMPVPDVQEDLDLDDLIEGTQNYQLQTAIVNAAQGTIYSSTVIDGGSGLADGVWPLEVHNGTTLSSPSQPYKANAFVSQGVVRHIELVQAGIGYTGSVSLRMPAVAITSSSILPQLTADISQGLGHGTDIPQELGANFIVVNTRKYYSEDDEVGTAVTRNDFRTISIVRNPIDERTGGIANDDFYDMTYKMTVSTGIEGISEDSHIVKVTAEAEGQRKQALVVGVGTASDGFQDGTLISCIPRGALYPDGTYDPSMQPVVGEYFRLDVTADQVPLRSDLIQQFERPFLMPYSGEVLQLENRKPLNRIVGQLESFSFVFAF